MLCLLQGYPPLENADGWKSAILLSKSLIVFSHSVALPIKPRLERFVNSVTEWLLILQATQLQPQRRPWLKNIPKLILLFFEPLFNRYRGFRERVLRRKVRITSPT